MPQNDPTIELANGNLGLVTNISAVEGDKASFRTLKNASVERLGLIKDFNGYGTAQLNIAGTLTTIPNLPSGFTAEKAYIFSINEPSNTECIIIFGTKSSRDRFYVWPDIVNGVVTSSGAGTFVSNTSIDWLELTEGEASITVNVVTSSTIFTLTGIENSTTNDYYNQWIIYNSTRSKFDLVKDYNSTNGQFTLKNGITGVTNGDTIILMRFRIHSPGSVIGGFAVDNEAGLPTFVQHGQDVVIHTGAHDMDAGPPYWLGYINRNFFDDSDLDFNAWHFDFSFPFNNRLPDVPVSISNVSESDDPLPDPGVTYWIPFFTIEFDGFQESNIFWKIEDDDFFVFDNAITYTSGQKIQGTITIDISDSFDTSDPLEVGASRNTFMSRRMTAVNFYLAAGEFAANNARWVPKTEFFFMQRFDINSSDWSFSTPSFTITFDIFGSHWNNGQRFPFSRVVGHELAATGATAKFEAQVGNRPVIGPIYDTEERKFRLLFATTSDVGFQTMPDVYPLTNRIDVGFAGVSEILGIVEQRGLLNVFGRETMTIADVSGARGGFIQEQVQKRGLTSPRALLNIEGNVYLSTDESILEIFDGNSFAEPSPGFLIKPDWDAFSISEKESTFFGYQKRNKLLFIAVGTTQRIFVYSLVFNRWLEYESDLTFLNFFAGTNDKLFGITSTTIVEINAETATESTVLTFETQDLVNRTVSIRECEMQYTSDVQMTLSAIDNSESITDLREKDSALFLPQDGMQSIDRELAIRTKRPRLKLVSATGTAKNIEIDSISIYAIQKQER
jgi:hypothetical protein